MGNGQRLRLLSGKLTTVMSFVNPVNKSICLEQICESNYQKLFKLYFTRSRIELFQKAESVTLATHQEQTYVLYGCCSGNLQ